MEQRRLKAPEEMCPCGSCRSVRCCLCCGWYGRPRTDIEQRADLVAEYWQHLLERIQHAQNLKVEEGD